ncbi:MAG: FtsX-like permease family protein, partial [Acidobacteria bacterium]|nr:FtsX-like permease family protein [Acidobacteriota bacterium]
IVRQLDPVATLGQMGPLADKVGTAVEGPRFAAFVVGAFAVLALSLATAGLYGVLSFGVNQRRREIGVRAALGATPTDLVVMVLKQGMTVTVIGLAMGLAGSIVASRAMASVLFGVEALDGVAFIAPSAIVLVVAAASCYLPGRRAAAVDPAEVLLDS